MKNNFPVIPAIIIGLILLGGVGLLISRSMTNTARPARITPTPQKEKPVQLQTFYLDDLGEPVDMSNVQEALSRNDARIDNDLDQLDADITFVDQVNAVAK